MCKCATVHVNGTSLLLSLPLVQCRIRSISPKLLYPALDVVTCATEKPETGTNPSLGSPWGTLLSQPVLLAEETKEHGGIPLCPRIPDCMPFLLSSGGVQGDPLLQGNMTVWSQSDPLVLLMCAVTPPVWE